MLEGTHYDAETGQLLTASYMDYTMPRADDLPSFKVSTTETVCPSNPLGIKGCGEAGAIGSPPALINAITDAIGNNDLTMPATPARLGSASKRRPARHRRSIRRLMYQFNYERPKTLADAESLLGKADDPKILAGGQTLIPTLKQRLAMPSDVIDIGGIKELDFIRAEGDAVMIGAATRHATVSASPDVQKHNPALAALAGGIGDPAVRHMGTLGGSIANNDPAADYPAACLGLDAKIHTTKRLIEADEFFTGMFETALQDGEIIKESLTFPHPEGAAYMKFRNPASRYAMVGVFVSKGPYGASASPSAVDGRDGTSLAVAETDDQRGRSALVARPPSALALPNSPPKRASTLATMHGSAEYRALCRSRPGSKRAVAAAGCLASRA